MTNAELITELTYCANIEKRKLLSDAAAALEAADKRIEQLEKQEPTEKQVVDYCHKRCLVIVEEELFHRMKSTFSQLPKEGEWIYEDLDNFRKYKVTCPHCGALYIGNYDAYDEPSDFNYCPHCGNICNPANLAWDKELSERERKEQTDAID